MIKALKQVKSKEDEKTIALFKEFKSVQKQGYLTKSQLIKILRWKSPRPSKHYEVNTDKNVQEITRLAFATKNENLKIHILTALSGVNYPSASAVLMFYDPKKYPVLDIRVWKQLHNAKLVECNERGQGFSLNQWELYLGVLRPMAKEMGLTVRELEKRIFDYDKKVQTKPIYSLPKSKDELATGKLTKHA